MTEEFSTARETRMARRDMRGGQQRARARVDPDGALRVDIGWDSPYAGERAMNYHGPPAGVQRDVPMCLPARLDSVGCGLPSWLRHASETLPIDSIAHTPCLTPKTHTPRPSAWFLQISTGPVASEASGPRKKHVLSWVCTDTLPRCGTGTVADEYVLQGPDVLNVISTVNIGGRSERTVQVYRRGAGWQPRFSFPGYFLGRGGSS